LWKPNRLRISKPHDVINMNIETRKRRENEKDLDMIISLAAEGGRADLFSRERGSMLYELEAEEIRLKRLVD